VSYGINLRLDYFCYDVLARKFIKDDPPCFVIKIFLALCQSCFTGFCAAWLRLYVKAPKAFSIFGTNFLWRVNKTSQQRKNAFEISSASEPFCAALPTKWLLFWVNANIGVIRAFLRRLGENKK